MTDTITKAQFEELEEAESIDKEKYHKLLEGYTGIVAKPYTGYAYYDSAGNYVGGSNYDSLDDLLDLAYIGVVDNG